MCGVQTVIFSMKWSLYSIQCTVFKSHQVDQYWTIKYDNLTVDNMKIKKRKRLTGSIGKWKTKVRWEMMNGIKIVIRLGVSVWYSAYDVQYDHCVIINAISATPVLIELWINCRNVKITLKKWWSLTRNIDNGRERTIMSLMNRTKNVIAMEQGEVCGIQCVMANMQYFLRCLLLKRNLNSKL